MKRKNIKRGIKTKTMVSVRTIVIAAVAVAAVGAFAAAFLVGLKGKSTIGICVGGPHEGKVCEKNVDCRDPKDKKPKWYQYKYRKKVGYCKKRRVATKPPTTRATKPPATRPVKPSDSPRPPEQQSDSPRPPKSSK